VAQHFDQELTVRALEDAYEEVCASPVGQERVKRLPVLPAPVAESA
jgi:hypothetical protein